MSKLTPSALRGLSVAAGTVGLAAVGAAAMAGQAAAAESGPAALAGGGLPVSTNAVPAVFGAMAHNQGTIAGIPLSHFPLFGQLPGMMNDASPSPDALPGLGYADLGEVPLGRSRPLPGAQGVQGERTTHIARHAAPVAAMTPAAPAAPAAPVAPAVPAPSFPPAAAPVPQAPAPAAQAPKAQTGPLDSVTNALHGLPVLGGLAGNLPLGGLPLGGLTNLGG
ncbi:hypothetical protein ABIA35_002631 [Catenulispora sp. MAP12-49]|uniref:hypothetical protein n=1 Tax=unclassified Catenulispora TaxID=414885 RepID=UPI003516F5D4